MSTQAAAANSPLLTFAPPYTRFEPRAMGSYGDVSEWRGSALIWRLQDGMTQKQEYDWLRDRPYGLPLIVLLPRPESILATLPLLPQLRALQPRAVVPDGALGSPERAKQLLASAPRNVADGVTTYLATRGMLRSRRLHTDVHRILELSAAPPAQRQ